MKLKTAAAALGLGLGMAVSAGTADAALVISYQIGGGAVSSCADGAACDFNTIEGAVSTFVTGAGYNFFIETAQSYPAVGSQALPVLRMAVEGNTAPGTGDAPTLRLMATQTGFTTLGTTPFDLASTVNFPSELDNGALQATATYSYYLDNSNTEFGTGTQIGSETFTYNGILTSAQSTNQLVSANPDGSFSLTSMLVLSGIDRGTGFNANSVVSAVPEPASLALLGMGLLGLGLTRRAGRRKAA
ncbi:PEP-CTERM sorting domain-containing protein [Pararoseomonas baculiformis]|nr:PEP-CTERM sorting domain-containing protein [Pararoseomonas baculiformis]